MPEGGVQQLAPGTRWRRRTASGVVLTAMAIGLRHVLDEGSDGEAVVIEATGEPPDPGGALDVNFDGRGPLDTWVVVRPWLLRGSSR